MAHILCLETATTNCSVSISRDGEVLALVEKAGKNYSHSENLHVYIKESLLCASLQFTDIDAVAVSKGPGSYTGLRIGVSAAKGLCYSLDVPLLSVPTLQVLARQMHIEEGYIIPMLDARRLEVYTTVFNMQHQQLVPTWAEELSANSFASYLEKEKVYFVGNSNLKAKEIVNSINAIFLEDVQLPSAKEMVKIAYTKFVNKEFEDMAYFEPYYLKDFVAKPSKKGLI